MPILEDHEDGLFWARCDHCNSPFRSSLTTAAVTLPDRYGLIRELRLDDWEITDMSQVFCPVDSLLRPRQRTGARKPFPT